MAAEPDDDSDVVFRGSPLYGHLQDLGLLDDVSVEDRNEIASLTTSPSTPSGAEEKEQQDHVLSSRVDPVDESKESVLLCSARSFMWPDEDSLVLEVQIAKAITESELLVQEDEDFVNNFILNEEILAEYNSLVEEKPSRASSLLSDVVLFSGSVAAVAGAVLYLSEKAKAATAAAALLPTALAAMTSVRIGNKVRETNDAKHLHQIIDLLLSDMKRFKQLVRKSLNLLQGMEMISQGNFLSVDPTTGASMVSSRQMTGSQQPQPPPSQQHEGNKAAQVVSHRTDFPALRHAALKCTLQIIDAYREAVSQLMEVSPLADHVDMQEHYIAFVDLKTFGLQSVESLSPSSTVVEDPANVAPRIAIKELKETAQIALVQQSEYLRRFSLTFCERVRDDNVLNKAGVLKHIRDLLVTIRKINCQLSRVLEYHQAMGFDMEKLQEQSKALVKTPSMASARLHGLQPGQSPKFVPLRSIYTSMFSTGLHLQHTLLKLRRLEQVFEDFEKNHKRSSSRRGRTSPPIPVEEVKLIEWLGNFQEIQAELNACIGCLDDGVSQISSLRQDKCESNGTSANGMSAATASSAESEHLTTQGKPNVQVIRDDDLESPTFDEVFEAIIAESEITAKEAHDIYEDDETRREMRKQSNRLLKELKGVLVHKAKEHEHREAKAMARQQQQHEGTRDDHHSDPFLFPAERSSAAASSIPLSNFFDDSFVDREKKVLDNGDDGGSSGSSSESSSVVSDCPTVKSASPKRPVGCTIARSVSGQFLDSEEDDDDEETAVSESAARDYISCVNIPKSAICIDNHHLSEPKTANSIRSHSTPDLKNFDGATQTCYKSFAPIEDAGGAQDDSDDTASSSSSGWESADELEANHLPLQSRHRRPLRPAAMPTKDTKSEEQEKRRRQRLRQKRERNRSNISHTKEVNGSSRTKEDAKFPSSTYVRLHETESQSLYLPDQKRSGFDGGLASEVASLALSLKNGSSCGKSPFMSEEVLGDPSSDSEDSM